MTDRLPDPRGVRIALVAPLEGVGAVVIEPPEVPIAPVPRVAGEGLLRGAASVPPVAIQEPASPAGHVLVDGLPVTVELEMLDPERGRLRAEGQADFAPVLLLPAAPPAGLGRGIVRREVIVDGWRFEVEIEPAARAALRERASRGREEVAHSGPTEVRAIIPGVVVAVSVVPGDAVVAGQQLLVVEAMKMQNELRAPRDGSVERVEVGPGRRIDVGDLLLVIG